MFSSLGVRFPDLNTIAGLMKEDGGIERFVANTVVELISNDGVNGDLILKLISESVNESESYLDKLTKERVDILNKIDKLNNFIYSYELSDGNVDCEYHGLLYKQLKHMAKYKDVLSKRIELM